MWYKFLSWLISVIDHLFESFFELKNQNEPITNKIHTRKILLMQLYHLLAIRCEKNGMEK